MDKLTLILVGSESLMAECGAQALARGHRISAVVTGSARLRDWARAQGLAIVAPGEGLARRLDGVACDWLLNIAGLDILAPETLALPRLGAVNFHDGPLPGFAGLNAPVWALIEGGQRHAITWHKMTAQVDTGAILLERSFDIDARDTALTLNAKCFSAGIESFGALLDLLEADETTGQPVPAWPRRVFRRTDRPPHGGLLDLGRPIAEINRLIRALDHGPYWNPLCIPKIALRSQIACVGQAEPVPGKGLASMVLAVDRESVTLACEGGALRMTGLRDQNGRTLSPEDHLTQGEILPRPSDRITAAIAQIAPGEVQWRDALHHFRPLHWARAGDPTEAVEIDLRDLPIPALILRFARAIGARARQRVFDLAFVDRAIAATAEAAGGLVSGWVPVHIDLGDPNASDRIAARLALAARAPGFARDLIARDSGLAPIPTPVIAICDGAEMPGASLILDLHAARLRYDPHLLSEAQAARLMAELHGMTPEPVPDAPGDDGLCMHQAFEAQVRRSPEATALVFEEQSYTYAQINTRANQLAHVLSSLGVRPDSPVALCVTRGADLVIGALAILKAGGAYVPLDPAYPAERLAFFLRDSGAEILVTQSGLTDLLPAHTGVTLRLDCDPSLAEAPNTDLATAVTPENLAYLIYTSGSTGQPKGVMVEHRNVANFFSGMDACIPHDPPGVWLAVTSLSFDISVLELFWTLARGFKVVLNNDEARQRSATVMPAARSGMDFSLMYWGNDDGPGSRKYQLLLDGARFADANGFCAIWTPERHFHAFGGPFPNPAVTGAAVAAVTRNIAVRAGSCVAPLHHPIRIAEDWAVIDNLTNGRTGLGLASGWHPVDFVIRPENRPPHNRAALQDMIDTLRRLWRGEEVSFEAGDGPVPIRTQPRPVSNELELWLTTAGNPETWADAGRLGTHVLTHLLGQSIAELPSKIALYHDALRAAGHEPARFKVTLMLHSFAAPDRAHAREVARGPMKAYLHSAAGLLKHYAWAFPAFKRPAGARSPTEIDLSTLEEDEVEAILDHAFERYFNDSGLFGTVADCLARVSELQAIGVTEIACLIDYGIAPDQVMQSLTHLAEVVTRSNGPPAPAQDHSIRAQIICHGVTHLQCTPSMARMLLAEDSMHAALANVPHILIGGEALPGALARQIADLTGQPVLNMYGPTETTIWSSATPCDSGEGIAMIGETIRNTEFHVVDDLLRPVGAGAIGELLIGGDGVTRGYWRRDSLTAERFVTVPFATGRLFRTGDLVRRSAAGALEFLGRVDHQVKIRGYRVELGEIESVLEAQPGVNAAVVVSREDRPGDQRLVAYYTGTPLGDLRAALREVLPAHMIPAHLVPLTELPLTPNRKIDRAALPAPEAQRDQSPPARAMPPAHSRMQAMIAEVWQDVLGVAHVSGSDHFFNLGGHSLLAVQAQRAIRERLAHPAPSITDIFRFPVLRDLARHLEVITSPNPGVLVEEDQGGPNPTLSNARAEAMARRRAMRAGRGAGS